MTSSQQNPDPLENILRTHKPKVPVASLGHEQRLAQRWQSLMLRKQMMARRFIWAGGIVAAVAILVSVVFQDRLYERDQSPLDAMVEVSTPEDESLEQLLEDLTLPLQDPEAVSLEEGGIYQLASDGE